MFDKIRFLRWAWAIAGVFTSAREKAMAINGAEGKPLIASKTLWLNIILGLAQVLPGVAPYIPQPYGVLALAIGNILVRLVTSQPISGVIVS